MQFSDAAEWRFHFGTASYASKLATKHQPGPSCAHCQPRGGASHFNFDALRLDVVTADTTFPSVLTSASVCYTTRHPFAGLHGRAYEARHGRPPSGFTRSLVVFRDAYASLPHTLHFGNVFKEVVSQRRALLFVLAALRTRLEVVDDVVGGGDDPRTQHCMEYVVEGGQAVFQDVPGLRYVSPCSKLFPQDRDRPLGDLRCSRMSVTLTKHSKLHNRAALHRAVCELDSSPNTPDEAGFCFLEGRHMEVVIDDLRWYLREYVCLFFACALAWVNKQAFANLMGAHVSVVGFCHAGCSQIRS